MYEKFVDLLNELTKLLHEQLRSGKLEKWMKKLPVAIKERDMLCARAKRAPQNTMLRESFKQSRNKVNGMIHLSQTGPLAE